MEQEQQVVEEQQVEQQAQEKDFKAKTLDFFS